MASKKKIGLVFGLIAISIAGIYLWQMYQFPDTLPIGQDPELMLPLIDFTNNDIIYGYGQVNSENWHNGIDFGVDDTTLIVAPCDAYVSYLRLNWFNEKGGHWQSNIDLRLNREWRVTIAFESWTAEETEGQLQANEITVSRGQLLKKGDTIGNLVSHGDGTHIHFGIYHNGHDVCPYLYFNATAKTIFEARYALVGFPTSWCSS